MKKRPASVRGAAEVRLKVCGPESIQTLRGELLGREVALICCGEAHEDAVDLTREGGVIDARREWLEVPHLPGALGPDPAQALATKRSVTLARAKAWAARLVEEESDEEEEDEEEDEEDESEEEDKEGEGEEDGVEHDGAHLLFYAQGEGANPKGIARLFPSAATRSSDHAMSARTFEYNWEDQDAQARNLNRRRLAGEEVSHVEHDALIAERKRARLGEQLELFDDWLIRMATSSAAHVELVLEAPVAAAEVEMHIEVGQSPAPPAHKCLQSIEQDSDEDSDEEQDPDDGTGSFIDYLRRRLHDHVPGERIHGIDPRDMGDCSDTGQCEAFQALLTEPLPQDTEEVLLDAQGSPTATQHAAIDAPDRARRCGKRQRKSYGNDAGKLSPCPLPSWEAFFGATAELLYYSPHVKADFTPFLVHCVRSPEALHLFFEALFFRSVPEALAALHLAKRDRPATRIRSLAFRRASDDTLQRRHRSDGLVPCRAAPIDRYLKARGSYPPRTWVAGMAERLRAAGAGAVVDAAKVWWAAEVNGLLADPKAADPCGDYFKAWLRECHREIYDDVERADPQELRDSKFAPSLAHPKSRKYRHNLREITIPPLEEAWAEIVKFDAKERASSKRERVLSKIIVDAFQVKLVDLAAVLTVADVVGRAKTNARVVVVVYAGGEHTDAVVKFWRTQGFSHRGLPYRGLVGKVGWEDDEPRGLELPPYLHDFSLLF